MIRHGDIVIDRKNLLISVGGNSYKFRDGDRAIAFQSISHLLLSRRLTRQQLFHLIYGDRADGGPLTGPSGLDVRFSQTWKNIFRALGVRVHRETRAGQQYISLRRQTASENTDSFTSAAQPLKRTQAA